PTALPQARTGRPVTCGGVPDVPGKETGRVAYVFVHGPVVTAAVVPARAVVALLAKIIAAVPISPVVAHTAHVRVALGAEVALDGSPHGPFVTVHRGADIEPVYQEDRSVERAGSRLGWTYKQQPSDDDGD